MALISLAPIAPALMPSSLPGSVGPGSVGTIPDSVAAGIFARQSQKDLDACIGYCNRKWPGDAQCIADCHEMRDPRTSGIADSSDFFAGVVAAPATASSDIMDLYNEVSVPDWATNTGINPGGSVVTAPAVTPSTDAPSNNTTLLITGGVAAAAVIAWLIFSK